MARRKNLNHQEYRVNCVGDTLTGRFIAASKEAAARGFARSLMVRDGNTIQVWTADEYTVQAEPETFEVELVR